MKKYIVVGILVFLFVSLTIVANLHRSAKASSTAALSTSTLQPPNQPPEPGNLEQLQALMVSLENCQLPCFWGFRPGETSLETIKNFVGSTGEVPYEEYFLEYHYFLEVVTATPTPSPDGSLWIPPQPITTINFGIENNQFTHMNVSLRDIDTEWLPPDTVELTHILNEIDSIPDIYLFVKATTGIFTIAVVYNDQGIAIEYTFRFEAGQIFPNSNEPIQICPRQEQLTLIKMWLQSPENDTLVEDRINPTAPPGYLRENNYYRNLEAVTDIGIAAFVEQVIADPNRCIETRPFNDLLESGMELY